MNSIEQIQHAFISYLTSTFSLDHAQAANQVPTINTDPQKANFGDLNSSAALSLAKQLRAAPGLIAKKIAEEFKHPLVEKVEVAGAGFINIYLTQEAFIAIAKELSSQQQSFFKRSDASIEQLAIRHTLSPLTGVLHQGTAPSNYTATQTIRPSYNIEFVSANPTGPLHFGHGRSGIIGDVLGNVLQFLGYPVTKEFYINDAGNQITRLGLSLHARCMQALGHTDVAIPEDGYQGDYLAEVAQECIAEYGKDAIMQANPTLFQNFAKKQLLERIKKTLADYGINFDIYFSEKTLHESGAILKAIDQLQKSKYLFEQDGAVWFRSTDFGDDKDRVLKKSNGELTYIAADVAYLLNKANRGFTDLVVVLGHDHHSYATRLEGIRQALGMTASLDVILYQLVRMKEGEETVKLSKRAGTGVTLDDVIKAVGKDVARFFYLHRKADAQLEFDLDLAVKKTDDNPVYYVQYAYVRICSILQKTTLDDRLAGGSIDDLGQLSEHERGLLKKIISLKSVLETISKNYQTHQLTYFIIELADAFHTYYNAHRVIDPENIPLSKARVELLKILKQNFAICLELLGISKPERM